MALTGSWNFADALDSHQGLYVTALVGDTTIEIQPSIGSNTLVCDVRIVYSPSLPVAASITLSYDDDGEIIEFNDVVLLWDASKPVSFVVWKDKEKPISSPPAVVQYTILIDVIISSGLSSEKLTWTTCYLNTALQMLFHVPGVRKLVFDFPVFVKQERYEKVVRALQVLFTKLLANGICSTKDFTNALGWTECACEEQHDVMEFLSVLLVYLEERAPVDLKERFNKLFYSRIENDHERANIMCIGVDVTKGADGLMNGIRKSIGEDNGRLTKVAQILFIHADGEHDLETTRSKNYSDVPTEIDMGEFVDGAGIYTLCAMALRAGGNVMNGHYFLACRPSMVNQWMIYNNAIPQSVNGPKRALEKQLDNATPIPVIFMYISQAVEHELYASVTIQDAPEFAKRMGSCPEKTGDTVTKTITIATDTDIRKACLSGAVEIANIETDLKVDVPRSVSQNDIYKAVAGLLQREEGSFRLRYASARRQPGKVIVRRSNTNNVLQRTGSACFFYLEPDDESTVISGVPILVALFDPSEDTTGTQFVGRILADELDMVQSVMSSVKHMLNIDICDSDLGVFVGNSVIRGDQSIGMSLGTRGACGELLVVQDLSQNRELDASMKDGFVSYYKTMETITGVDDITHDFAKYRIMKKLGIDVAFYKFNQKDPVFKMCLPAGDDRLTDETLRRIILEVTNEEDRPMNMFMSLITDCPDVQKIDKYWKLREQVRTSMTSCEIYYEFTEHVQGNISVRIDLSENAVTVARRHDLSVSRETRLCDAVSSLGWEMSGCRALRIVDSSVHAIMALDATMNDRYHYRVERIQDDTDASSVYVKVSYGSSFRDTAHFVRFGCPFLFALRDGENDIDMKKRLMKLLSPLDGIGNAQLCVLGRGNTIIGDSLELVKECPSLSIAVDLRYNTAAFFDEKAFFHGGVRFLN